MLYSNAAVFKKKVITKTLHAKDAEDSPYQNQYLLLIFLLLAILYPPYFLVESLRCPEEAPQSRMEKYNYVSHLACNGQPFEYE